MEFPVDLLDRVDPEYLEQSAKEYMSQLLCRNPETHDYFTIPDSKQIELVLRNMSFVPLYGVDVKKKVLALFLPEEDFKVVGLYLLGQWWSVEDILKTAARSRTGLHEVLTTGERIVLYVLNRIFYRTKEMTSEDVPFLCHGENEIAKILWKDGEAIGFYSVKAEGSLCSSFLTQCYQLPVMDTIFVRKSHRGNGYGLYMLEDFVGSFRNDFLGLKYPLTTAMYKVCKQYLSKYPEDQELLWEVKSIGGPFQRKQIAKRLQAIELKGNHTVVGRLNFESDSADAPVEDVITQVQRRMEYTEKVVVCKLLTSKKKIVQ
uniref:Family with sequence similarity 169 member Aa n=1 Tax=Electrophorus electricus TaxID=8005 RepID=A0A4W4FW98_ELEEL